MGPRFYGLYRGIVRVNIDSGEEHPFRGLVKVAVPQVYGELVDDDLPWAEPCFPVLGGGRGKRAGQSDADLGTVGHGLIALPPVGSTVWVAFEQGDPQFPIWLGTWFGDKERGKGIDRFEMPFEAILDGRTGVGAPDLVVLKAPHPPSGGEENDTGMYIRFVGGSRVEIVFNAGKQYIELDGVNERIVVKADGWDVNINATNEGNITLQAAEGAITLAAKDIIIRAEESLVVRSEKTANYYAKEQAVFASKQAIYGSAPEAAGFDAH